MSGPDWPSGLAASSYRTQRGGVRSVHRLKAGLSALDRSFLASGVKPRIGREKIGKFLDLQPGRDPGDGIETGFGWRYGKFKLKACGI